MYARAHADVAPTSSKTMPKSQVIKAMVMAERISDVVKMRCRLGLYDSWGK